MLIFLSLDIMNWVTLRKCIFFGYLFRKHKYYKEEVVAVFRLWAQKIYPTLDSVKKKILPPHFPELMYFILFVNILR